MSRRLSDFGTRVWPVRPSALDALVRCPMSVVLRTLIDEDGGKGAQTGSLTHAAVEQFHLTLNDEEGIQALLKSAPRFPLADTALAERWYRAYVADPTNRQANVTHLEQRVELDFEGVYIVGTLDQIRLTDRGYEVWDLKTGTYHTPVSMLREHRYQQAAYVLAARQTLGLGVIPGGLIRVHGYSKARGDVFLRDRRTVAECEEALREVVRRVCEVRSGGNPFTPGDDACRFCPVKPYPACTKRLQELT